MAIKFLGQNADGVPFVTCLSTDPKPVSPHADVCGMLMETDTGTQYYWNGTSWVDMGGGGAVWGDITGTLANQTDLNNSLNGKAATGHNHDASYSALSHTHPATEISDSTATGRSLVTAATTTAARTTLELGDSATRNVGTLSTQVAQGDAVSTHEAAADPHTGYQRESEKNAASGYPGLSAGSKLTGSQQVYGTAADTACQGNDSRLSDSRTPTAHAASHKSAGGDAIKLDELAAPTDVTTLNVSTTLHGLFPKLPGGTTNFWREDGTWTTPPGGSQAFPIGSVFIAVVSTNPATLLGYGTWSAIAAGRMLVGLDSGDTDFDLVEETGGAKTKTIAQANLPNISTGAGTSHNHTQDAHTHVQDAHNHTQDAHSHITQRYPTATGGSTGFTADTSMSGTLTDNTLPTKAQTATNQVATATNQNATATNQAEAAHTHSLGGSGTALNVMNPYFVVYLWKRTA